MEFFAAEKRLNSLFIATELSPVYYLKAGPGFIPSALNILTVGQNPVKDAWRRFKPTNAVNHNQ